MSFRIETETLIVNVGTGATLIKNIQAKGAKFIWVRAYAGPAGNNLTYSVQASNDGAAPVVAASALATLVLSGGPGLPNNAQGLFALIQADWASLGQQNLGIPYDYVKLFGLIAVAGGNVTFDIEKWYEVSHPNIPAVLQQ